MEEQERIHSVLGHLFRHEAGRMAAVLTRLLGFSNLETAEDIVQDALLKALSAWKFHGIPENPSAWLYAVARNKAIDVLRKEKRFRKEREHIARLQQSEWTFASGINQLFLPGEIEDSQLRMIFACCHPSIPYESQIALTLKTLCGLSVQEIARAFVTPEETIAKRLYRAREKIRQEKIELDQLPAEGLTPRIHAVLKSLYLLFNEGYNSLHPDNLIRKDLCEEAMRLCLLLTRNTITNTPPARALLSLMCFQASRFDARIGADGGIILLQHQDRSRWNKTLIARGQYYLNASSAGEELSEYHLESAIAACHALADTFEQTHWSYIHKLYDLLSTLKPGPIVDMNRAIATAYLEGPRRGIEELQKISGLENNYLYHTALGDFFAADGDRDQAQQCYEKAAGLTHSKTEIQLLKQKMEDRITNYEGRIDGPI